MVGNANRRREKSLKSFAIEFDILYYTFLEIFVSNCYDKVSGNTIVKSFVERKK